MGLRTIAIWLAGFACLSCGAAGVCFGQFGRMPAPGVEEAPRAMMIVPPNRETLLALNHAREALKQNRTADAFQLLQRLIELPEDYFLEKSMEQTLKSETLRILSGLTAAERQAYELLQGTGARKLLEEAKAAGQADRLAEIVRRYPLTQASFEAAELLAVAALDRGHVGLAAGQLAQLRQSPLVTQTQSQSLAVREALAWHLAGQTSRGAELLLELTNGPVPFRAEVAGQTVSKFASVADAARWLAQATGPIREGSQQELGEWWSARGSAAGSVPAPATGPIGGPLWQFAPLTAVEAEANPASLLPPGELLAQRLTAAEAPLRESERLPWIAATPLVLGDLMVFRTLREVIALDCRTGEVRWRSVLTDAEFDQRWLQDLQNVNDTESLAQHVRDRLFDDQTFGSLTSDGKLVFSLEGREAPASALGNANNARLFGMPGEPQTLRSSRLAAYEARGGRLVWEIGGERQAAAGDFAGHYFLGPPVAEDGTLFALAEVQGELRLLALEASPEGVRKLWSQPLAAPLAKITESEERQQQALLPACENGIVVCPTGTGAVIAVDFALRRLLWAYAYPSAIVDGPLGMNGRPGMFGRMQPASPAGDAAAGWIDGNPIVAAGRVFLTPTDSDELVCLNLADGKLLWKQPRERAVYLAGADHERVLLVGPDQLDAVRVTDGAPAWKNPVSIPTPTGRGVWMRDRYLVPLSTGEIATVDLTRGRLLARSKLPDGQTPGNLAASSRYLVSLSARQALAFRGLAQIEELVAQKLEADPEDAAALALRGEARLHRGELEAGLADLRAAIALRPEPYGKSVLAAALLDVLRTDFVRYRDTVAELDQLTVDPQQRREFLWLVARGLQTAGEPLAVFERMTPLIEGAADEISLEPSGGAWQARTDRRLAGLFAALYRQARPDDRQRMDEKIESHLAAADAATDGNVTAILQRHLQVFGFHPSAAAARQRLTARLDPDEDAAAYERELSRLAQNADSKVAGPASGKLARWFLNRKRFDEVDLWLAALEGRLADAVCDVDLTGRQLAEKLRADGDYVESRQQYVPWPEGEITAVRTNQPNQSGRLRHVLVVGPVPAHYQGWSFETDPQGTMLIARDESARHRWTWNRTSPVPAQQPFLVESPPGQHRVHLQGHLVGWSTGTAFQVAADLESLRTPPRLLWQETLLPPGVVGPASPNRVMGLPQPRMLGPRRRVLWNEPFASNVPAGAGSLVALTDSAVIYHNGRRLFAADPLTGEVLWSRNDLSRAQLDVLADEETIAVSMQEGVEPAQVRLLRTIDGEPLGAAAAHKPGEWIGGGKVLTLEATALAGDGPLTLQLHDVARGEPIWQTELARPAAFRIWNQAEVFTIEANRKLTVRNLADGTIRWSQELALEVAADALYVQRWKDRYLVILGATPAPAASPRVVGFDLQHLPLFGYAVALQRETGELLWQTPINEPVTDPTSFDASQPAGWPALVFAGQLLTGPQPGAAVRPGFVPPVSQRLTLSIIDKETGKQKYAAEEQSNIAVYYVEVDPERNRMQVNFLNWAVDLHYTGKRRK